MIISHAHKFIFIKPRKTAGTSFELALSPHLRPGDYATAIEPEEEPLRQVHADVHVGVIPYKKGFIRKRLRDHSPLSRAIEHFGPEILDYKIISMARNPWDRAVSQFYWTNRRNGIKKLDFETQKKAFEAFTIKWAPVTWRDPLYGRKRQRSARASNLYCYENEVKANFLVRFEHINEDAQALSEYLNLPEIQLPDKKMKSEHRGKKQDWRAFYSPVTKALIAKECAEEISLMGYDFERDTPEFGPIITPKAA